MVLISLAKPGIVLDREMSPTGKGPDREKSRPANARSGNDPVGKGLPGKVRSGNARSANDSLRIATHGQIDGKAIIPAII